MSRHHRLALLGTAPAGLHAVVHVAHLLAVLGARLTDLRTGLAGEQVAGRTAEHKAGRNTADLGAVGHQREVRRRDMPATALQAVLMDHVLADRMALGARLDAAGEVLAVGVVMEV